MSHLPPTQPIGKRGGTSHTPRGRRGGRGGRARRAWPRPRAGRRRCHRGADLPVRAAGLLIFRIRPHSVWTPPREESFTFAVRHLAYKLELGRRLALVEGFSLDDGRGAFSG